MKLGIVGLPNVGKSTLFNALTKAGAEAANYPFCTIDPNIGVVAVPDGRLDTLKQLYNAEKLVPAFIEFVDIAGLVKGASAGEGLGNTFLAHIREVDALVHVVRCFHDPNVVHVDGGVDPRRDIETINIELILADLETVERRLTRQSKAAKADKSLKVEADALLHLKNWLDAGKPAKTCPFEDDVQAAAAAGFNLLTGKPVLYAANVSEGDLASDGADNPHVAVVKELALAEGAVVFTVCAQIEAEIAQLPDDEKAMFLEDLGVKESGLDKLVSAGYELLGLVSFLTAGPKEVRAWTITKGTKAPQAAGKIHTDFERGFIRAEVVSYADLVRLGSVNAAKESGLVRSEGKDYALKDDDVVLFRFNV